MNYIRRKVDCKWSEVILIRLATKKKEISPRKILPVIMERIQRGETVMKRKIFHEPRRKYKSIERGHEEAAKIGKRMMGERFQATD